MQTPPTQLKHSINLGVTHSIYCPDRGPQDINFVKSLTPFLEGSRTMTGGAFQNTELLTSLPAVDTPLGRARPRWEREARWHVELPQGT